MPNKQAISNEPLGLRPGADYAERIKRFRAVHGLTQQALAAAARYGLHAEAGVVAAAAGEPGIAGSVLVRIEAALTAGRLDALRDAAAPATAALRGPLRQVLHYHLGSPLLRTRQVMQDLHQLIAREASRS